MASEWLKLGDIKKINITERNEIKNAAKKENINNSDDVYNYFKKVCASESAECGKAGKIADAGCMSRNNMIECIEIVANGRLKFCKEKYAASVCASLPTTPTITTTSTVPPTTSTSSGSNPLPFIIGGVIGVVVLLALAIGLFCYCRKKKKMGKNQSMTGTTTGGTSGTGTGTATGTTTKTGRTRATGTNTCAKY